MIVFRCLSLLLLTITTCLSHNVPTSSLPALSPPLTRRVKISMCNSTQTSHIRHALRRMISWAKAGADAVSQIQPERSVLEHTVWQLFARNRVLYHFKQNNEWGRRATYKRLSNIEQEGRDTPTGAKVPIWCHDFEEKCDTVRPAYVDDTLSVVVICAKFYDIPEQRPGSYLPDQATTLIAILAQIRALSLPERGLVREIQPHRRRADIWIDEVPATLMNSAYSLAYFAKDMALRSFPEGKRH